MEIRYSFQQDMEGFWYLIPEERVDDFILLCEENSSMFDEEFGGYVIDGSPADYSFTSPEELE